MDERRQTQDSKEQITAVDLLFGLKTKASGKLPNRDVLSPGVREEMEQLVESEWT